MKANYATAYRRRRPYGGICIGNVLDAQMTNKGSNRLYSLICGIGRRYNCLRDGYFGSAMKASRSNLLVGRTFFAQARNIRLT